MAFLGATNDDDGESHWLSVADLMAGLMMVFLFIAVTLMRFSDIERAKIKDVAEAYQENQVAIYEALIQEFSDDLINWDADIEKETLTFTFNSPEILFARGAEELKIEYQTILADFSPRYLDVLHQFRGAIEDIRIEGHTSSVWGASESKAEAYFYNMDLSQRRTQSVLQHVYYLPTVAKYREWIHSNMSAVGMSSAKIRLNDLGVEDRERSRRVGFRVVTKADTQIKKILDL